MPDENRRAGPRHALKSPYQLAKWIQLAVEALKDGIPPDDPRLREAAELADSFIAEGMSPREAARNAADLVFKRRWAQPASKRTDSRT
jgi:hypothetical protein